jgi:hypothetical protein
VAQPPQTPIRLNTIPSGRETRQRALSTGQPIPLRETRVSPSTGCRVFREGRGRQTHKLPWPPPDMTRRLGGFRVFSASSCTRISLAEQAGPTRTAKCPRADRPWDRLIERWQELRRGHRRHSRQAKAVGADLRRVDDHEREASPASPAGRWSRSRRSPRSPPPWGQGPRKTLVVHAAHLQAFASRPGQT